MSEQAVRVTVPHPPQPTYIPGKSRKRRIVTCRGCSKRRKDYGRRLCAGCYTWWRRHGKPANVPPPAERQDPNRPRHAFTPEQTQLGQRCGHAAQSAARIARVEDYQWLTGDQGHTRAQAAERLGIRPATARQYTAFVRPAMSGADPSNRHPQEEAA